MTDTRFVIVTTSYRGVFGGYVDGETAGEQVVLRECRMLIYWANKNGLLGVAQDGPAPGSKISGISPRIELRSVTAVIDVADGTVESW